MIGVKHGLVVGNRKKIPDGGAVLEALAGLFREISHQASIP